VVSKLKVRELNIPGTWEITPTIHGDSRGLFFEWLTDSGFTSFAGHRLDVRQANCSVSSAGVLRGLHFAQLPPSQAKYVTCVSGSVFDVVVDIRVGSPTFGQWDSVVLDDTDRRTIYISEGLAHGFLALQDNSTVIQPEARAHHPRDGSGAGDRLAARRRRPGQPVRPRRRGAQFR
jgi:dTDP-4-dehydrorhamnose 3,5-epimerase